MEAIIWEKAMYWRFDQKILLTTEEIEKRRKKD
jgi:hypothetical protein